MAMFHTADVGNELISSPKTNCVALNERVTDAPAMAETIQSMSTQASKRGLSNKIHAVFRRSNFKNISDANYNFLKPSLQLASLFLTTPELAGFPYAILVGNIKHVPHPENKDLDAWSYQPKDSKLSSRDMAMYNLASSTFADMVVFVADKDEDLHSGTCCYYREVPSSPGCHLRNGSVIYFSDEKAAAHTRLQSEPRVKWRTFETAKILLHELMHAMNYARVDSTVVAFGSNKVVETGYEWENHIFGGVIEFSTLEPSGLDCYESFVIHDWPAASTVNL
jgi:hypothetical protein